MSGAIMRCRAPCPYAMVPKLRNEVEAEAQSADRVGTVENERRRYAAGQAAGRQVRPTSPIRTATVLDADLAAKMAEKAENTTHFTNAVRDEGVPEFSTCVGALRVDQVAGLSRTMEIERPRYGGITPGANAEIPLVRQMARQEAGSLKAEVVDWIQTVSGSSKGDASVAEWLHDGRVLCALINAIRPGAIPKVNEPTSAFEQKENITYFWSVARDMGVLESSMCGDACLGRGDEHWLRGPAHLCVGRSCAGERPRVYGAFAGGGAGSCRRRGSARVLHVRDAPPVRGDEPSHWGRLSRV